MEIKFLICAFLASAIFALFLAALMAERGDDSAEELRLALDRELEEDHLNHPIPLKHS